MEKITLEDILDARKELASVIKPTNLIFSEYFSEFFGKKIFFKPENLQLTGSFKVRGAYYKLFKFSKEYSGRKVVCASAGNHAQGVALAGKKLGFKVLAVMPEETPIIKVEAVKSFGAEVMLFGRSFEEAYARAMEYSLAKNIPFIHPYDDEAIIAGQGTVGLEIIDELPNLGTVIVPVGGGGLIAGMSLALKKYAKKKKLDIPKIIGVQSHAKIAEGILCKKIGKKPKILIDKYVDEMVEAGEEEIASAILMFMEKARLVVEGAGAVGLAAMLSGKIKIKDIPEPIVLVLSGGNIDISLMGKIIRKGLHNINRMVSIVVEAEDRPGILAELTNLIACERANIYKIDHERSLPDLPLTKSRVKIILETWGKEHILRIIKKLKSAGYKVEKL